MSAVKETLRGIRFSIAPEDLVYGDVSDQAVRLYLVLARYANIGDSSFPSRKTLAEKMRRNVRTVDRAKSELETKGWLVVTARYDSSGNHTSNEYTLNSERVGEDDPGDESRGSDKSAPSDKSVATPGDKSVSLTRTTQNESPVPSEPSRSDEPGGADADLEADGVVEDDPPKARGAQPRASKVTVIRGVAFGAYREIREFRNDEWEDAFARQVGSLVRGGASEEDVVWVVRSIAASGRFTGYLTEEYERFRRDGPPCVNGGGQDRLTVPQLRACPCRLCVDELEYRDRKGVAA